MISDQPNKGREEAYELQLTVANFLKTCMSALLSVDAKYASFIYLCWGTGNHALKKSVLYKDSLNFS